MSNQWNYPISVVSTTDYFKSAMPSLEGLGSLVSSTTPIAMVAKKLQQQRKFSTNGLGGEEDATAVGTGVMFAAFIAVVGLGILSYQAGKAMAPTKEAGKTWGWVGVPMGLLLPFGMGLGVMGVVSNSKKK